jgi:very-short-patch-repair endonuclease
LLRDHRLDGRQFRRQHPIGPYIVDFVCPGANVVVEIDGAIHEQQREYDADRDDYLRGRGYTMVRFTVDRAIRDLPGVLQDIRDTCSSPPLHRNGEGVGG